MTPIVRIANAQGFWGDRNTAAAEILEREPDLDFLTMDYLAEVSMSILALQRERAPELGYARDFVDVVRSLAGYWRRGGRCRLIANAGGLNPRGCAEACRDTLQEIGCREMTIAVVSGDDVLEAIRSEAHSPAGHVRFRNLDSGAAITDVVDHLVTANAYLGAVPIVQALSAGADIVITGRVADPSLTVAAAMSHFGWTKNQWNCLAGATIAGHLIECGTQVTGGISTDWLDLPDPTHIGFPIVEVSSDGSCVVTLPAETGGCVNEMTVKEQLVYETGDPAHYLSPDVCLSFLGLRVEDRGKNRVHVSGARGSAPPDTLKVSATWRDGYRAAGMLTICGSDAVAKAIRCGEIVLQRVREAGFKLRETVIECLGTGEYLRHPSVHRNQQAPSTRRWQPFVFSLPETVLRVAVETDSRTAAECFSRELIPMVTSGPPGTTGYAEGRPRVHPVFRYWPCLIDRDAVEATVELLAVSPETGTAAATGHSDDDVVQPTVIVDETGTLPMNIISGGRCFEGEAASPPELPLTLESLAVARSGDKGTSANIGVVARQPDNYEFLRTWLTEDRVAAHFEELQPQAVTRYELPNLHGLNFVLKGALRCSLRTDAQGKGLGQALLQMPLPETTDRSYVAEPGK